MKLNGLAALGLLATIALAPAAASAGGWHHNGHGNEPLATLDTTGVLDLGIDITQAGSTPENISRFLGSLEPGMRDALVATCHERVRDPSWHQPSIVSFCQTVIHL